MKITLKKIVKAFIPYGILKVFWYLKSYLKNNKDLEVFFNYLLHNRDTFRYDVSTVAIFKDEMPYLKEWLEYHKLVGVDHFYLYDDGSTDNPLEILQRYIDNGEITYTPLFDNKWAQGESYEDAIQKYKNESKWIAFIDIDEFIVPVTKKKIPDILEEIQLSVSKKEVLVGLAVHWVLYGYSGHKTKPDGLVTENYIKSDGIQKAYKSIVNPRTVVCNTGAHSFGYFFGKKIINEKGVKLCDERVIKVSECVSDISEAGIEKIRINHYWTKSYEEFAQKTQRNRRNHHYHQPDPIIVAEAYKLPPFDPDYLSRQDDMVMDKIIPFVKESLNRGIKL